MGGVYRFKNLALMFKSLLTASLMALCGTGWSKVDFERANSPSDVDTAKPGVGDPQQRRNAMRAALRQLQEQKPNPPDGVPQDMSKSRRPLNAQERQLLRQQLRQQ